MSSSHDIPQAALDAYSESLERLYSLLAGDACVAVFGGIPSEDLFYGQFPFGYSEDTVPFSLRQPEIKNPARRMCVCRYTYKGSEIVGPVRELVFDLEQREGRWWWTIAVG